MNLSNTNYQWKKEVDLIFETWWDKILQTQKLTFWVKEHKKLKKNITILHFMPTFNKFVLKIETCFKPQRCLGPLWKLEMSMVNVKT